MKIKPTITATVALSVIAAIMFTSCASIPKGVKPVKPFDIKKYLGTWYEIARFDYRFEKNLDNVTADYAIKKNGKIRVVNAGYNYKSEEWKSSVGKAKFSRDSDKGALKVSFFGPFYTGYNVIALAGDYEYALVAGKNFKYLWILSRVHTIPESVKNEFLIKAKSLGFDTERLIWVQHDKKNPNQ